MKIQFIDKTGDNYLTLMIESHFGDTRVVRLHYVVTL